MLMEHALAPFFVPGAAQFRRNSGAVPAQFRRNASAPIPPSSRVFVLQVLCVLLWSLDDYWYCSTSRLRLAA